MVILLRIAACITLLGFVAHLSTPGIAAYALLLCAIVAAGLAEILNELRRLRQFVQGDSLDQDKARILARLNDRQPPPSTQP